MAAHFGVAESQFSRHYKPFVDPKLIERVGKTDHYHPAAVREICEGLRKQDHDAFLAAQQEASGLEDDSQLERKRRIEADIKEIELKRLKDELLPIDFLNDFVGELASKFKSLGEKLAQKYGNPAKDLVNETLDDADRVLRERWDDRV